MASLDFIMVFDDKDPNKNAALADAASTAEFELGTDQVFSIIATGAFHLKMGLVGLGAADAGDDLFPANAKAVIDTGRNTHIRVFNDSGAAIDIYTKKLFKG